MTRRKPVTHSRVRPAQGGFTIVEIMVALLILSIGLLGLASLQVIGVKNSGNAYYRTQAVMIANETVERIRMNKPAARNGEYDAAAPACEDASGGTLAEQDLAQTACAVTNTLPGGSVEALNCAAGATAETVDCALAIIWRETRQQGDASEDGGDDDAPALRRIALDFAI
ncbi:MAG: type IV pilus modification protein PilV [Thiotrichales bacterium]